MIGDNLIYLTPKFTVVDAPGVKLSLGGFFGAAGFATDELDTGGRSSVGRIRVRF